MIDNLKIEMRSIKERKEIVDVKKVDRIQKSDVKVTPSQASKLPPFFQDNPWISVLSQRGRDTEEFAG